MRHIAIALIAMTSCIAAGPPKVPLKPMPDRTETVTVEQAVESLDVAVRPYGAAGWELRIKNDTDANVSAVWDESTFVASNGDSGGRLIRGETRRMDTNNAQPATLIPPHAFVTQIVFIEKIIEMEGVESDYAKHDAKWGGISPDMARSIERTRAVKERLLPGGALNVTLQLADGKKTWIGRVSK